MTYRESVSALVAAFAAALVSVSRADGPTPYVPSEGTSVGFECAGEGIADPCRGRFTAFGGRILHDPAAPATTRGNFDLLLASVETGDSFWDAMFRAAGFIGIAQFPRARFELRRLEIGGPWPTGDGEVPVVLHGRLTIRGIAKETSQRGVVRRRGETLALSTRLEVVYDDFEILVPTGSTRRYTGDRVGVTIEAVLAPASPPRPRRTR